MYQTVTYCASWWSMVDWVNSIPTRIPNLGWGEKGNFIQCKELNCESQSMAVRAAWRWGGPGMRQPWVRPLSGYTTLLTFCTGLLHTHLQCFSSRKETQSAIGWEGKPSSLRQRGTGFYRLKSLPWFLIGPSSCKWELQIFKVWLVQKTLSWLVRMEALWSVSEDVGGDITAQLQLDEGKPQSSWWKYSSRNSFIRAGSDGRNPA